MTKLQKIIIFIGGSLIALTFFMPFEEKVMIGGGGTRIYTDDATIASSINFERTLTLVAGFMTLTVMFYLVAGKWNKVSIKENHGH